MNNLKKRRLNEATDALNFQTHTENENTVF